MTDIDTKTPLDVAAEDIRAIHPDYPTPIEQVNLLYRDHTARVRAYFREQVAQEIEERAKTSYSNTLVLGGPLAEQVVAVTRADALIDAARIARGDA